MSNCVKIIVKGVLGGFGYLGYVYIVASSLGIRGQARYIGDSAVEVIAIGSEELLNEFISMLRHHDTMAIVSEVYTNRCPGDTPLDVRGFYVELEPLA